MIWAGIWRRPGRAALTLVSMVSAFVLFGVLQGFSGGLGQLVNAAQADLLGTQSQVSTIDPLPVSLEPDIARTPGVRSVVRVIFMGGPFRDDQRGLNALAIDPAEMRAFNDTGLKVTPDQWTALQRTKTGALISADLARLFNLKVGDRIPLTVAYVQRKDGTATWPVDIVGIYPDVKQFGFFGSGLIMNYAYVDDARTAGAGTVNVFIERIDDPAHAGQVAAAIDRLTVNSAHATRTFSQKQLALAAVAQIGQVGLAVQLITGAVFFALLFSVGAVMIQGARERTGEMAVLKALGFGDGVLMAISVAESLALCLAAAAVGLALSGFVFPVVIKAIQFDLTPGPVMGVGLIVAVLLALAVAAIPAWRTLRLSVVDALAGR